MEERTTEEMAAVLQDEFVTRLENEMGLELPEELASELRGLPIRVDEDEEVNRMRANWIRLVYGARN